MDTGFGAQSPETIRGESVKRHFSVEEANRALPLVSRIVADIAKQYRVTMDVERAYQNALDRRADVPATESLAEQREAALDRLNELVEELGEIGVELKDWEMGLVDFPCLRGEREVYLCWKAGEDKVSYWHELYEGFAGRQKITPTFQTK